ncbi:MAG: hypothetical protein ACMG6E_10640, partial [Candidatus Roizmanbacteria bacterium]
LLLMGAFVSKLALLIHEVAAPQSLPCRALMVGIVHVVEEPETRLVISMEEAIMVLVEWVSFLHFLELFNAEDLSVGIPCLLELPVEKDCLDDGLVHDIQVHLVLGFVLGSHLEEVGVRCQGVLEIITQSLTFTFWQDDLTDCGGGRRFID